MGYMISRLQSIGYNFLLHAAFQPAKPVTALLKKSFPPPFIHFAHLHDRERELHGLSSWRR